MRYKERRVNLNTEMNDCKIDGSTLIKAGITSFNDITSAICHTLNTIDKIQSRSDLVYFHTNEADTLKSLYNVFDYAKQIQEMQNIENLDFHLRNVLCKDSSKINKTDLIFILGEIMDNKTLYMNALLNTNETIQDTLYVSHSKSFIEQLPNSNDKSNCIKMFNEFEPTKDNLDYKNLYIDSVYINDYDGVKTILDLVGNNTNTIVITLDILDYLLNIKEFKALEDKYDIKILDITKLA